MEETSIATVGSARRSPLCTLVEIAFQRALALDSRLPEAILTLSGMSGRKYRRFVNTLVGSVPNARYLEVGSWAGSTACSAMFANKAKVTCIDNWSQFEGPRDVFFSNVAAVRKEEMHAFAFIESDFRAVDYTGIGTYNIYMFDGPHEYQDQFDGVALAVPALDDECVLIVDDWNYEQVRAGTMDALREHRLSVPYAIDIRTTQDGNHPQKAAGENSAWHNGYFLAVVTKDR